MRLPLSPHLPQPAEADAADAAHLRTMILDLASSIDRNYVEVGRLLLLARDQELFRCWGFTTLESFGETVLRFKPGKLRYLMQIAATIDHLQITPHELADIAWSKLLLLKPVLTIANKTDWLARAKTSTVTTLRRQVAIERGFALPEEPITILSIRLSPTQRQTVEDALALGMRLADTTSRAVALVSMAQEAISSFAPLLADRELRGTYARDDPQCNEVRQDYAITLPTPDGLH